MLNMLVVDDNLYFAKVLINNIVQINPDLRLCMIATDGKEALNAINTKDIDLILLDLKIPIYNGLDIIEYLVTHNKNSYCNSIIVISGENDMILKIRNNPLIYSYINKGSGMESILREINQLISIKKEQIKKENLNNQRKQLIRQQINTALSEICYANKYDGTKYLSDTIYFHYFLNKTKNYNVRKKHSGKTYP